LSQGLLFYYQLSLFVSDRSLSDNVFFINFEINDLKCVFVMERIENKQVVVFGKPDFQNMNCGQLVDYIVQKHHQYAFNAISEIKPLIDQVIEIQEENDDLKLIRDYFGLISNELSLHMKKEELVLFPNIHHLVLAEANGTPYDKAGFGKIKSPASVMMIEHQTIGLMEEKLLKICDNINSSAEATEMFAELYQKLKVWNEDLQQHAYLEDDILVPKIMALMQVFSN
jgi:regulator of cell morphogenesis and NO signaling